MIFRCAATPQDTIILGNLERDRSVCPLQVSHLTGTTLASRSLITLDRQSVFWLGVQLLIRSAIMTTKHYRGSR